MVSLHYTNNFIIGRRDRKILHKIMGGIVINWAFRKLYRSRQNRNTADSTSLSAVSVSKKAVIARRA